MVKYTYKFSGTQIFLPVDNVTVSPRCENANLIPAHLYKDGLRHIHPDSKQCRTLTVREAARLQTFDDDYIFDGSNVETYKMIGNAVPPLFAKELANAVADLLKDYGK